MRKRSKISIALLVLIGLLVIARVLAPGWITSYVNKTLDKVPGYAGSIDDVDLNLWRGAYTIHGLNLRKTEADAEISFVAADEVDLSMQWKSLIKGSVVGEIEFIGADLNFVSGKARETSQFGEEVDWTKPVRELLPIEINRMAISDGSVRFVNQFTTPPVDIALESVELEVLNLKNVVDQDNPLPSPLKVRATSIGDGALAVDGKINILKQVPDFDINGKFEGVSLPALNDFLKAYAMVDAEKGIFNLYVEMAADGGQLDGYVKPVVTDLQILSLENDSDQPLQLLWEGLVGFVSEVFENQPNDQFASKVPISGSLENTEVGVTTTIVTLLRNAFVQALKKRTDGDVTFAGIDNSVGEGSDDQSAEADESEAQEQAAQETNEEQADEEQTDEEKGEELAEKALEEK